MNNSQYKPPRTILVGGHRKCITWIQRALLRGEERERALRPKKQKKQIPGGDKQLRLPGM
jgi:hypothetical protein